MIRFGLCCIFHNEPIKFRHATAKGICKLDRAGQLTKLSDIALHNAEALLQALDYAAAHGIGAFRIMSQMLPLYTHPEVGYVLDDLPEASRIRKEFGAVKKFASENDIRLSFHPDQFVVLASPTDKVVANSIKELCYQCMLAELVGAENVNLHMGGVYGDKAATVKRFSKVFQGLPEYVKSRLTLENDDYSYHVADLYPVCMELGIPLVYDVHHHRCNPDCLSVEEATAKSIETWDACGREPHFHISSPRNGWDSGKPQPHSDYIDVNDFPECWLKLDRKITVDLEAKFKELAIERLRNDLGVAERKK